MSEMANEIEDEVRKGAQDVKQAYDVYGEIRKFIKVRKKPAPASPASECFTFTGQLTDLRYFQNADAMPVSLIQNIPDEQLREAVMDTFNKAIADGKITMNPERTMITITDGGRELLKRPTFQQAARTDLQKAMERQAEQLMQQPVGVMLDGTVQDLGYFQFSDQLDMRLLMQDGNSDTFFKIAQNFQSLEEQGIVTINNTVVTLTEKGRELIASPMMKPLMQGVTERALSMIPGVGDVGKIFIATRQVLSAGVTVQNMINV